jgi:uncharacterized protein
MKISLSGLPKKGKVVLTAEKSAEELKLPKDNFLRPVSIELELEAVGEAILCRTKVGTASHQICDRCAIEFDFPLRAEIAFKFLQKHTGGSIVSDSDEVKYYYPDNPEVDITPDIRDELILALPMKILCREDCKGLCPRCGADLNVESCNCNNN